MTKNRPKEEPTIWRRRTEEQSDNEEQEPTEEHDAQGTHKRTQWRRTQQSFAAAASIAPGLGRSGFV